MQPDADGEKAGTGIRDVIGTIQKKGGRGPGGAGKRRPEGRTRGVVKQKKQEGRGRLAGSRAFRIPPEHSGHL
jgi:hypothetical protein